MEKSILIQSFKIDNCVGFIECDTKIQNDFLNAKLINFQICLIKWYVGIQMQTMANGIDMHFEWNAFTCLGLAFNIFRMYVCVLSTNSPM